VWYVKQRSVHILLDLPSTCPWLWPGDAPWVQEPRHRISVLRTALTQGSHGTDMNIPNYRADRLCLPVVTFGSPQYELWKKRDVEDHSHLPAKCKQKFRWGYTEVVFHDTVSRWDCRNNFREIISKIFLLESLFTTHWSKLVCQPAVSLTGIPDTWSNFA